LAIFFVSTVNTFSEHDEVHRILTGKLDNDEPSNNETVFEELSISFLNYYSKTK